MIAGNNLMLGIVLIVVGLAVALIAVAYVLNRREAPDKESSPENGDQPLETTAKIPEESAVEQESEKIPEEPPSPTEFISGKGRKTIAVLKQNILTDSFLLAVGDVEYKSINELKASPDWKEVEPAIQEMKKWLLPEEPTTWEKPASGLPAVRLPGVRKKKRSEAPKAEEPKSMVEQINEIIEQKIRESGRTELSVRLIEGLGGDIRAYIGVDSYPLDEIPDDEVSDFLRACVREWEQKI